MIPLHSHRAVALWILACMSCVAMMVFIGGVTRLTESGLSIVEWKLVSGILPPIGEAAWAKEFTAYQTSPEYKRKNFSFGVEEFKRIFWLEYLHRLLGRLTGLIFLLPLLYFSVRRALPTRLFRRMCGACLLVGAQGAVGWVMVASGLVDDPRVNPAKLALHLLLAFTLFGLLLWTYWQVRGRIAVAGTVPASGYGALTCLLVAQILIGALVAGNDAGLSYNSYPLMDGHLVPQGLMTLSPWHKNLIVNIVFVQFAHRLLAHLLLAGVIVLVIRDYHIHAMRPALALLAATTGIQFLLGVLTLVYVVPIPLASAHQMGALALLGALLNQLYSTQKPQSP